LLKIHEHVHKRLAPVAPPQAVVGQLGILKPLAGALGDAGVSQLVANLILAPMQSSKTASGSSQYQSLNNNDDGSLLSPPNSTDAVATNDDAEREAYLLAPSTSAGDFKLQMVEIEPSRGHTNESSWKRVEFQVTLTNAHNEPRLYCATVRPPSSLRMEMCDAGEEDDSKLMKYDGASRRFLYDSSTGEVIPYEPNALPGATQNSTTSNASRKRGPLGAAMLAMNANGPEAVKLVFFTNQSKSSQEDVDESTPSTPIPVITLPPSDTIDGADLDEMGVPPLLDPSQPSSSSPSPFSLSPF
jgi:hypothetical protein